MYTSTSTLIAQGIPYLLREETEKKISVNKKIFEHVMKYVKI